MSLGVASDTGVVRPLLAALTFHQFFEGVALGACFLEVGTCSSARLSARLCRNICSCCLPFWCIYTEVKVLSGSCSH